MFNHKAEAILPSKNVAQPIYVQAVIKGSESLVKRARSAPYDRFRQSGQDGDPDGKYEAQAGGTEPHRT
jgi:hypothetical protein